MNRFLARLRAGSRRPSGFALAALVVFVTVTVVAAAGSTARAAGTYSIVDLGTLGGGYSEASAINNNGQVAGIAGTADGQPRCFIWTEGGGMADLGFCDGYVRGLNSSGHVSGVRTSPTGVMNAFLWTSEGGFTDLGVLAHSEWGDYSDTARLNESDQVVGGSTSPIGRRAFSWTRAGGMVDLGPGRAYAVNDNGEVAGGDESGIGNLFVWSQTGGRIDLGVRGMLYDINSSGQVAGWGWDQFGYGDALFWSEESGLVYLGNKGTAYHINSSGQIAGSQVVGNSGHAYLWSQENGMVDLGTLGGDTSYASDLNDSGQVVGHSTTANGESHAFVWSQETGMVDLGTLGGGESSAFRINASGQIVGWSMTADGYSHAVLWNPVSYVFHGFFPPIDNGGVFNVVNAGRAVPVKFDLNADQGLSIFADGYPRSTTITCPSSTGAQDLIEQTVGASTSSLHYDPSVNPPIGQYTYTWKTDKSWAGTCRQLQLKLSDGQLQTANFSFTP